jgi:hypothetical protein
VSRLFSCLPGLSCRRCLSFSVASAAACRGARVWVFGGCGSLACRVFFAGCFYAFLCCRFLRPVCLCVYIGAGCSHPVAGRAWPPAAGPVAACLSNKCSTRAFRTGVRNKCSTVCKRGYSCVFNRILTEYWNRILRILNRILTEPNRISVSQPNRIRTESLLSVFNRIFEWLVASACVT